MTANWLGNDFDVWSLKGGVLVPELPGLYILAKTDGIFWVPLYIGISTRSVKGRFKRHHRFQEALAEGATHIHTLLFVRRPGNNYVLRHHLKDLEDLYLRVFQPCLNRRIPTGIAYWDGTPIYPQRPLWFEEPVEIDEELRDALGWPNHSTAAVSTIASTGAA